MFSLQEISASAPPFAKHMAWRAFPSTTRSLRSRSHGTPTARLRPGICGVASTAKLRFEDWDGGKGLGDYGKVHTPMVCPIRVPNLPVADRLLARKRHRRRLRGA